MASQPEVLPADPRRLGDTTVDDPAAPLSAIRVRLLLSNLDQNGTNKRINPATGAVEPQTGSKLLLPTVVEPATVYELDTTNDLDGVYAYLSNNATGYQFLSTFQNTPQLVGESRIYSTSPELPADTRDNILYLLSSLTTGQPGSLYIYRTDRYAGGGTGGATPFGPLTASGAAGETFALPAGTKSVRGVQVLVANPGAGQYPVVGLVASMYTLNTSATPPTLSVLAPYTLSQNDTIEGIAFAIASSGGISPPNPSGRYAAQDYFAQDYNSN
jgi:hypothetical protein